MVFVSLVPTAVCLLVRYLEYIYIKKKHKYLMIVSSCVLFLVNMSVYSCDFFVFLKFKFTYKIHCAFITNIYMLIARYGNAHM